MGTDSQGKNSIHNSPHIADFHLKCCILKEDTKNNISGRNIWMHTLWSDFQMDYICALELKLFIFQL